MLWKNGCPAWYSVEISRDADRALIGRGALVPFEPSAHRGGLFGRALSPFFDHVRIDPEARERLERAHAEGHVVHVLRCRRILDPVFILHALERLRLPKPQWMHDHYASRRLPRTEELIRAITSDESALLFLRRPRTLVQTRSSYAEPHVEALVDLQRRIQRPILLVPETLLWSRRAAGLRRTIIDTIFGDRESPGRLREMVGFLLNYSAARYYVGAPVSLKDVLARSEGEPIRIVAKKVRWAILHHLTREEALRTGPREDSGRTKSMVLKDPSVQKLVRDEHKERGRAKQILDRMAADGRYGWLRVLDAVVDKVWNDIYDGIIVDQEGLQKVWAAARRGPIVLVPSHKSHVDYIVLSQVFFKDGMMPPHVAAGDNLSFWPLGPIFRRGGAFFIRRSFKGDKLYSAICAAYIKRLLKEGRPIEFFIEGGRSRTGKLLTPKMGILSMCVAPVLEGALDDVSFIPVSISYEKIVEAKSYAKELEGGQKKKEDVAGLLSTPKVLRSKYGRVYVDFDEPISLRAFAAARGLQVAPDPSDDDGTEPIRRELVHQLGHRIVYSINRATRVTPTGLAALVLLSQTRRGMTESDLFHRADKLMGFLVRIGARLSSTLNDVTRLDALRETLGRLAQDGLVLMLPAPDGETVYRVDDPGRRALDFYKNNTLHFFAPYSIVCLAALHAGAAEGVARTEVVQEHAGRLSRLLKYEFSFAQGGAGLAGSFRAAVEHLEKERVLAEDQAEGTPTLSVPPNGRELASELAEMVAVFLEALRVAAEAAREAPHRTGFSQAMLMRAQRQVLEGRILRPEGASKLTLENSVSLLFDLGLLERKNATIVPKDIDGLEELIQETTGYLKTASAE